MKHQKIKINKDKYKIFSLIKIQKIHITIETAQVRPIFFLTLVLLNPGMSCFANNVDPDQLASEEPTDLDLYCLPLSMQIYINNLD